MTCSVYRYNSVTQLAWAGGFYVRQGTVFSGIFFKGLVSTAAPVFYTELTSHWAPRQMQAQLLSLHQHLVHHCDAVRNSAAPLVCEVVVLSCSYAATGQV